MISIRLLPHIVQQDFLQLDQQQLKTVSILRRVWQVAQECLITQR